MTSPHVVPAADPPLADSDSALLVSAMQELSQLSDLEGVMAVVRRAARELTGADGVTFVLREGDQVFYAEENAIAPLWKGRRFPASACISGWAILNRVPVVIEDIYTDPRIPIDAYRATFVKSLAMVPVRPADPIGAIGAYWATRHRASERELRLLATLAGSTAIAVANAELYREAQRARAAAEAASRAKDDFLAVLSHELRTPLTSILGWARMLRTKPLDADRRARAYEIIERNAHAQTRLVETLLDSSLVVAGQLQIERRALDLAEIVREACDAVLPAAAEKELVLEVTGVRDPLPITGDPARLLQVLDGLLSNAVKFTPRRGRIEVTCRRKDGSAEVRVTDNGQGIDPGFMPHLYEPFRQEDGSRMRRHGGLGLGLWLATQIVTMHGGVVYAESSGRGQGTTFLVTLPLAPAGIS